MAAFQARQKAETEDWAAFADDLYLLAETALFWPYCFVYIVFLHNPIDQFCS